jgi:hypothetical protein
MSFCEGERLAAKPLDFFSLYVRISVGKQNIDLQGEW